jgi:hypothetical protein
MSELRAPTDPERLPPKRPVRGWQVVVAAVGLAMAVAGFVFWLRGAQSPGLAGTWTGSAAPPTAGRAFPVRLDLGAGTGSVMRWGADLHCSGMLGRTRSALVYELMQVRGEGCYRGTLRIFPTKDTNQVIVRITREHETDVTYSGTLSRLA